MSERLYTPDGGVHKVPPERPYREEDYALDLAMHEGSISDQQKKILQIMGTNMEATMHNNMLPLLRPHSESREQAEQALTFFSDSPDAPSGEKMLRQKALRRLEMIKAIDEIAAEEGLDFSTIEEKANYGKVFTERKDDIVKVYTGLRNRGFTKEEIAA